MSASPSYSTASAHQCMYRNKVCLNVRAFKKNGQLHSLCEFHRLKANSNQRKLEKKKRDSPAAAALPEYPATTKRQSRAFGVKELWVLPSDVEDAATGDEDVVIWVQPIRVEPPQQPVDHMVQYEV